MTEAIKYILLYAGAVISVAHIFDLTYHFQVKEYRFDRFLVLLEEEGFLQVVYSRQIRFPAKTLRNTLVILLSILFLALVIFFVQTSPFIALLGFVVFAPTISFLLVSTSVFLTGILAYGKRALIVKEATQLFAASKAVCIGITGSYGKTTTKEFLYQILARRFKVAKTEATMNTDVGVALSVLRGVTPDTEFFIAEMGSYKKGEIERASKVAPPHYAILTAIGNQHLSLFGSREGLLEAKKELLEAVPSNGRIYLNKAIEDKSVLVRGIEASVTLYSSKTKADITVKQISKKPAIYKIVYKRRSLEVQVPVDLPYAIENLLPCVGLALDLGMKPEEIRQAVRSLKELPNKLSQQKGLHGSMLVLDTSNSSVEGFLSAIEVLSGVKASKKLAVTKGIIELGEEKTPSYLKLLEKLSKNNITLLTTDRLFEPLDGKNVVKVFNNENAIISYLNDVCTKKTALLVEGRFTEKFLQKLESA